MVKILDGKKLADRILDNLKRDYNPPTASSRHGRAPIKNRCLKLRLAVILIGNGAISKIFIHEIEKDSRKVGINFNLYKFPARISRQKLKEEIDKIVRNSVNSGIVVQLPLPKKFSPEEILNLIPQEKDINVLSEKSLGKFYQGTLKILPPTVEGILELLKNYKIKILGKDIAILGIGRLVGLPLAIQLLKEKATVSALNEFTMDTPSFIKKADILISGVGKQNLIKENMIKKGAVVIDAGTAMKNGKLVGDVDFKSVFKKASFITPVPGGVGPMTVACLLKNLITLSKNER